MTWPTAIIIVALILTSPFWLPLLLASVGVVFVMIFAAFAAAFGVHAKPIGKKEGTHGDC